MKINRDQIQIGTSLLIFLAHLAGIMAVSSFLKKQPLFEVLLDFFFAITGITITFLVGVVLIFLVFEKFPGLRDKTPK